MEATQLRQDQSSPKVWHWKGGIFKLSKGVNLLYQSSLHEEQVKAKLIECVSVAKADVEKSKMESQELQVPNEF